MTTARHPHAIRRLGLAVVVLLCIVLASETGSAQEAGGTYTNPVSKNFADTFADPAVIEAEDGYW